MMPLAEKVYSVLQPDIEGHAIFELVGVVIRLSHPTYHAPELWVILFEIKFLKLLFHIIQIQIILIFTWSINRQKFDEKFF